MSDRRRFWSTYQLRKALLPDRGMAEAEGLAAGTGLLTGDVARTTPVAVAPCPDGHRPWGGGVLALGARAAGGPSPWCGPAWPSRGRGGPGRHRR